MSWDPRSSRRWRHVATLLFLVCAVVVACGSDPRPTGRALVIAVDGATNRVIEPQIEAGELPTFEALRDQGGTGPLRSYFPLLSPRIWTTVATGKTPKKHGIHGWVMGEDGAGMRLFLSSDRVGHAIWNIAGDAGRSVAVINWLNTHPPEVVNGVMITDHAIEGVIESRTGLAKNFIPKRVPEKQRNVKATLLDAVYAFPVEWMEAVQEVESKSGELLTDVENPWRENADDRKGSMARYMMEVFDQDSMMTRLGLRVQRELRPDLMMVYLPGIDRVSHFIWSGFDPGPIPPRPWETEARERQRSRLLAYYRHVDQLIAKLTEDYGPDDLVIVLSDHGFETIRSPKNEKRRQGNHKTEGARDGILYVRGPGIAPGSVLEGVDIHDITPTLLAFFGLPVAKDMDGEPFAFAGSDLPDPIPTYDLRPIERLESNSPAVEGEIIEQLKGLGYVE